MTEVGCVSSSSPEVPTLRPPAHHTQESENRSGSVPTEGDTPFAPHLVWGQFARETGTGGTSRDTSG